MTNLDGKVALITGAARGQGRAHAVTLAGAGADVVAFDIAEEKVDTVPYPLASSEDLAETGRLVEEQGRSVLTVQGDVRSQSDLDRAVTQAIDRFGRVDILVANAGIWALAPFWELSEQQWTDMIDVNLTGVWHSAKAVAPSMIERRSGSIVMTSSVNGLQPGPNYAHYVSTKHGIIGLMRNVALELAPHSVRCNAICPGAINTQMLDWQGAYDLYAGHEGGTRDDLEQGTLGFHALAGAGPLDPQVLADAVLWLVSDDAAMVTGVALPVDAGHMILPGSNPSPVE